MSRRAVEQLYPLSPAQHGLLARELVAPETGHYVVQLVATLHGDLDVGAFRASWQAVHRRYEALRSSFVWESVPEPLQVVHADPPLSFVLERAQGERWLEAFLLRQRRHGIDVRRPALHSITLARVDDTTHHMVWCYHHLLLDGWSSGLVLRDVFAEYDARVRRQPSGLPAPAGYRRYAAWLRAQDLTAAERFWASYLAGIRPAQARSTDRFASPAGHARIVSGSLQDGIDKCLRAERITSATLVHAAWAALLARRTGADDVVFGSVVSGRPEALHEANRVVGALINVLPVRVRFPGDAQVGDWLRGLQRDLLEVRRQGAMPLSRIANCAGHAGAPLFDSIITIENYPDRVWRTTEAASSLQIDDVRLVEATDYPLTLEAIPAERLVLQLLFDDARVHADGAERLLDETQAVMSSLVNGTDRPLRSVLQAAAQGRSIAPAPHDTIASRWVAAAASFAESVAAECGQQQVTYRELARRAQVVAAWLDDAQIGAEDRVLLLLDRSIDAIAAILGVLQAGACFVPVEPTTPAPRLEFIAMDTRARVAITTAALASRVEALPCRTLVIDRLERCVPPSGKVPCVGIHPEQAAYVIYTSGSTGSPKGVVVTHRNVVRLFSATEASVCFSSADVWTLFHSYAFDFSIWEIFGALLHGGRLVIVPWEVSRSPEDFLRLVHDRGVTVLSQTPSAFRLLEARDSEAPLPLPSLRVIVFGGESLPFDALGGWCARHGCRPALVNMYGITETTVHVTARAVDSIDAAVVPGTRIGAPLPDLDVRLLDPSGDAVPDGEAGEICVAGPGLARGYLGDPGLTASRFVPDSLGRPGERLYRSGDLGRRLANGDLEYLGRIDRQLKIRGHRIEPGEIEAALRSHPAVEDAAVVVTTPREGPDMALAACVVPSAANAGPVRRLIQLASQQAAPPFELPDGTAVFHEHASATQMMFDEIVGGSSYVGHGIVIADGDCVFDVGANIGLFALSAHRAADGVKVYAFEPLPDVHRILDQNVRAHGIRGETFNVALGAAEGDQEVAYFPHVSVVSGSEADSSAARGFVREYVRAVHGGLDSDDVDALLDDRLVSHRIRWPVRRLSDVMRERDLRRIDLLKIDVEGSEEAVLAGIDDEHWPCIRQIAMEVHSAGALGRLESLLRARHFTTSSETQAFVPGAELWMLYAISEAFPARTPSRPARARDAGWRSPAQLTRELRAHVAARLPEHMLPHTVSLVSSLPLTANGKIDRAALAHAASAPVSYGAAPPRNDVEATLCRIWRELLGVTEVGTDDSFFELGGDSIVAVRMVSSARQAGLRITPAAVFEHRTISALAAVARPLSAIAPQPRPRTGPVPLTPIQHWFFAQRIPNRNHWNQAVLFELSDPLPPHALEEGLRRALAAHDVFSLRFEQRDDVWRQEYAGPTLGERPLLTAYAADREQEAVETLHHGLDLAAGTLLRGALIGSGAGAPQRLLLVAHHLVADAVSWRILLEDLMNAAREVVAGRPVTVPAPHATFREWSDWLQAQAADEGLEEQASAYLDSLQQPTPSIPRDFVCDDPRESSSAAVFVSLTAAETASLIHAVAKSETGRVGDVVLAAVSTALARWTGSRRVRIDVESHGRSACGDLDLSRSVGWFTTMFPVVIDTGEASDVRGLLAAVKEALASVPRHGLAYGLLRYLRRSPARHIWGAVPAADVSFNFHGDLRVDAGGQSPVRLVDRTVGMLHDPEAVRTHAIAVEAAIVAEGLTLRWSYSTASHKARTVDRVAAASVAVLRRIVAQAAYGESRLVTPEDFPLAELTPGELDVVLGAQPAAEDVYPLTPAQQGLFFHALFDPASTVYFTQFHWTMRGALDVEAFRQSWNVALRRHPALRTAFVYRGLRTPHQIVCSDVELSLEYHDWRGAPTSDERWEEFLRDERARPFDLARAPLMRLALVRTADEEHRLVWNHHHILFDGWCTGIILEDVFAAYAALSAGHPLTDALTRPAPPYRAYAEWLKNQDLAAAETFWRARLRGFEPAASPFTAEPDDAPTDGAVLTRTLDRDCDRDVRGIRRHGLTMNTLLVGAWAAVLSHACGSRRVIVGSTTAGRPTDLDHGDRIVGLFINTLPIAIEVDPDARVIDWLTRLQQDQLEARRFEHVSLAQIQRWSGRGADTPLLDTAVVFENLPPFSLQRRSMPRLAVTDVGSFVRNHFALTIRAVPRPPLRLEALFDPRRVPLETAEVLLDALRSALVAMGRDPSARVGALVDGLARRDVSPAVGG